MALAAAAAAGEEEEVGVGAVLRGDC